MNSDQDLGSLDRKEVVTVSNTEPTEVMMRGVGLTEEGLLIALKKIRLEIKNIENQLGTLKDLEQRCLAFLEIIRAEGSALESNYRRLVLKEPTEGLATLGEVSSPTTRLKLQRSS